MHVNVEEVDGVAGIMVEDNHAHQTQKNNILSICLYHRLTGLLLPIRILANHIHVQLQDFDLQYKKLDAEKN